MNMRRPFTKLIQRGAFVLAIVLSLLLAVQAAFAYVDVQTLGDFRVAVDYQGNTPLPGQTTWTYEIGVIRKTNALSHWTLGLGECFTDPVSPQVPGEYTTPEGPMYNVTYGPDGSTGVSGLKFDSVTGGTLGSTAGVTETFVIVIDQPWDPGTVEMVIKNGSSDNYGTIFGPVCRTTAVTMSTISGDTGLSALLLLVAIVATSVAVAVLRKGEKR